MTSGVAAEPQTDLRLGYVGVEARDVDAWENLGRDGIGFHTERKDGFLIFRMDDHARRFIIWEGPLDDVAYLGWEAKDAAGLQVVRDRLRRLDVAAKDVDAKGLRERAVAQAFQFTGPNNLPCEVACGIERTKEPLKLNGVSGFHAGDAGLGHIAFVTDNAKKARSDFEAMLGVRHTDDIISKFQGLDLELNFFHLNPRHHSVAIGQFITPGIPLPPKRLAHIMVEMNRLEDVAQALVRCKSQHRAFGMELGQHPNDRAISFYVINPCGFEFEIATGCITIEDEAKWKPVVYDKFSLWGHNILAPA